MEPYLEKGYHVLTDNHYNSLSLTDSLSSKETYITGTIRKGRKRNPKKVISTKLKKSQMVWKSKRDITVAKWKDKRDVLMISNAHIPKMTTVTNRKGNDMVKDCKNAISDIDRSDQMLSYNSGLRKTLNWYQKARLHILEMFLIDALYLNQKVLH